jgi:hypothetical protein
MRTSRPALDLMNFDVAERIADALLFESIAPSTAGSDPGLRWQLGIVAPRSGAQPAFIETACLIEPTDAARLSVRLRWLQLERCRLEPVARATSDGPQEHAVRPRDRGTWIRPVERAFDVDDVVLSRVRCTSKQTAIAIGGRRDVEPGYDAAGRHHANFLSEREAIDAQLSIDTESLDGFIVVRLRIENRQPWRDTFDRDRSAMLMRSLISTHFVAGVEGCQFVSLLDPPGAAKAAAAACRRHDTWPVLVGDRDARDLMLASPIVLPDYPADAHDRLDDACTIDQLERVRSFSPARTR